VASFQWTAAFTTPALPSGLVVAPDAPSSTLTLTVTASTDLYHEAYVWEAQSPDGDWIEVDRTTDPLATYLEAPLNVPVSLRVRDWNGAADSTGYSDPVEVVSTLASDIDQLVHPDGDPSWIRDLTHVAVGTSRERKIDQVVLQPLSGPNGDSIPALVYTGQWQGDALTVTLDVLDEERDLLRWLDRVTRLGVRYMLLKTIKGAVYRVQLGSRSEQETVYGWRITLAAVQVA
jgi:hypothetical protein